MLHAVRKLFLPPMLKSYMSCFFWVREGKHTKGNRAKGHLVKWKRRKEGALGSFPIGLISNRACF